MEIQRLKLEQANQAAGIAAAMRDGAIKNFAQPKPTEQSHFTKSFLLKPKLENYLGIEPVY